MLLAVFGQHAGLSLDWAVLLGALFLAHPIHTESAPWKAGPEACDWASSGIERMNSEVLYIVGRADLLCLLLVLLAALIYAPCIKAAQPAVSFNAVSFQALGGSGD